MGFWDNLLGRSPVPTLSAQAGGVDGIIVQPPRTRVELASSRSGHANRRGRLEQNEAIDASVHSVTRIFDEAALGRTSRMVDLYKSSRRHDDRLDTVCATRATAIQGRPWVLKPPPGYEGDSQAITIAADVTTILNETKGLATLFGHLAHGVLEHLAVLEHRWGRDRRGMHVTRPQWVHPNRAGWQLPEVLPGWALTETALYEGKPIAGTPFEMYPDKFVVFAPVAGRSDYPWHRGAMRSRVAASVAKRMGFRFWFKMLERWGQPQVYAQRSEEADSGDLTDDPEILKALRELGSDWRAEIPAGWDLKSIPVQVVTDLHSRFIEHADVAHAVAILGQNLTTEIKGGSFAAAKAHQLVRLDLLASDLAELAECVTDQWIEPMVRWNWGADAPVPYLDFILGTKAEITVAAYLAGLFSDDEARASMGWDPKSDGSGGKFFEKPKASEPDSPAGDAVPDPNPSDA